MVLHAEVIGTIKQFRLQFVLKEDAKYCNNDGLNREVFSLRKPSQCLILEQKDWHEMFEFSKNAILMVLASENFDESDYIFERYDN